MRHNDQKIIHPPLEVSVSWTPEEALDLFRYLDQLTTVGREEPRAFQPAPSTYPVAQLAANPA